MNTRRPLSGIMPELKQHALEIANRHGRGLDDLDPDEDFTDGQIFDSLGLLEFVLATERVCGIKIPGEDVVPEHFGSLRNIAEYLRAQFGFEG